MVVTGFVTTKFVFRVIQEKPEKKLPIKNQKRRWD